MATALPTAGDLRDRVRIQRRSTGVNALNEATGAWNDVAEVWAKVSPARTRMRFAASQAQSPVDTTVLIRYRTDVLSATDDFRLVHETRVGDVPLEIDGEPIDIESAGQFLEIACIKGVRDGR